MFLPPINIRRRLPGTILAAVMWFLVLTAGFLEADPAKSAKGRKRAIEAATDWLVRETPDDPVAYLSLAILARRFGIETFADMGPRYVQVIESKEGREQRRLRAFQRLLEVDAPVETADLEAITEGIDRLTSRALNCQRYPLPSDFELTLRTAMSEGGYFLTHSALALQWIEENGCDTAWSRRLRSLALQQLAKIPDVDLRLTDLELEAATFLVYMDSEQLLPPGFVDGVLEMQREDGGWPGDSASDLDTGHWHATSLALWILMETSWTDPAPMIPQ